jgi:hypothetical protein
VQKHLHSNTELNTNLVTSSQLIAAPGDETRRLRPCQATATTAGTPRPWRRRPSCVAGTAPSRSWSPGSAARRPARPRRRPAARGTETEARTAGARGTPTTGRSGRRSSSPGAARARRAGGTAAAAAAGARSKLRLDGGGPWTGGEREEAAWAGRTRAAARLRCGNCVGV